jgi:hypothetical protein
MRDSPLVDVSMIGTEPKKSGSEPFRGDMQDGKELHLAVQVQVSLNYSTSFTSSGCSSSQAYTSNNVP